LSGEVIFMSESSDERKHSTYPEKITVWAHLGYGIMKCQVLEHRLADVLFMCEMLNGEKSWADKNATMPRYHKMTMGWLKNRLCEATTLPSFLLDGLNEICGIRNELAHRYFKPRIDLLLTRDGAKQMALEIDKMSAKIEEVIEIFHRINNQYGKPLGYSDEAIDRVTHDFGTYWATLPQEERVRIETSRRG
jgi:hypothetical protein